MVRGNRMKTFFIVIFGLIGLINFWLFEQEQKERSRKELYKADVYRKIAIVLVFLDIIAFGFALGIGE